MSNSPHSIKSLWLRAPCGRRKWNPHCVLDSSNYNKNYEISNYSKRNEQIAQYCTRLIAFVTGGALTPGTKNVVAHARKLGKKVEIYD